MPVNMFVENLCELGFRQETDVVFRQEEKMIDLIKSAHLLAHYSRSKGLANTRLCLHACDDSKIQKMVIFHSKEYRVPIHKHKKTLESILMIDGDCLFKQFEIENTDMVASCISSSELKSGMMIRVDINTWHNLVFRRDSLFLEISEGPFNCHSTTRLGDEYSYNG